MLSAVEMDSVHVSRVSLAWDHLASGNLPALIRNQRRAGSHEERLLYSRPMRNGGARPWSVRRINAILQMLRPPTRYLEIGVAEGYTLESVSATQRTGVEPAPRFDISRLPKGVKLFPVTSDEFFASAEGAQHFDVVFLDGLHTFEQTYQDLLNSFNLASPSAVLIDDTVPCDEPSSIPDQSASTALRRELGLPGCFWHGDVWKVVTCVARHHRELSFRTIIGPGNPQTLVWRNGSDPLVRAGDSDLRAIAELAYRDAFQGGVVPESFHADNEGTALAVLKATL